MFFSLKGIRDERIRSGDRFDRASCWLHHVLQSFTTEETTEDEEDLGVVRKCLIDGWIVGYIEFRKAVSRKQAGYFLKMNPKYLFGCQPKRYRQVQRLLDGYWALVTLESYNEAFETAHDQLYTGLHGLVKEHGGVGDIEARLFNLIFQIGLNFTPFAG